MTELDVSVIREQGCLFMVVLVDGNWVHSTGEQKAFAAVASAVGRSNLKPLPLVLLYKRFDKWCYYGAPNVVRFMSSVSPAVIPWNYKLRVA